MDGLEGIRPKPPSLKEWLRGIRAQVSLLLEHGHPEALSYPIGRVWEEAELVVERINSLEATRATLFQMAASTLLSQKAHRHFSETLQKMTGAK